MGLLDGIEKVLNTANRATSAGESTIRIAGRAKGVADTVSKAVAKKCKECQQPLKTDLEKQKGLCMNCALKRV